MSSECRRKSAERSITVFPASTRAFAYSAAAPCGSAKNHTSISIFACSSGEDGENSMLSGSRWRSAGIESATFVPARLREVTHANSTLGWRASNFTISTPAYPEAPVIPALIFDIFYFLTAKAVLVFKAPHACARHFLFFALKAAVRPAKFLGRTSAATAIFIIEILSTFRCKFPIKEASPKTETAPW